jgi:hypothetical protein
VNKGYFRRRNEEYRFFISDRCKAEGDTYQAEEKRRRMMKPTVVECPHVVMSPRGTEVGPLSREELFGYRWPRGTFDVRGSAFVGTLESDGVVVYEVPDERGRLPLSTAARRGVVLMRQTPGMTINRAATEVLPLVQPGASKSLEGLHAALRRRIKAIAIAVDNFSEVTAAQRSCGRPSRITQPQPPAG